jgi:hypothetical protein
VTGIRLVGVLAVVLGACFTPEFNNVQCGPMDECPPGHSCNTSTGLCEKGGGGADTPDADPGAPDADPLAPDATPGATDSAVPTPDAPPIPDCDLFPQDGCGNGMRCTIVADSIHCLPVEGPDAPHRRRQRVQ